MPHYEGSCHCGAVAFAIETDEPLSDAVTCNCSICHKKRALMKGVPESRFRILKGQDQLTLYQFNTKTAEHYFCKICGIYPFHRRRTAPDHFAINVCCLEGVEVDQLDTVHLTDGKELSTVE